MAKTGITLAHGFLYRLMKRVFTATPPAQNYPGKLVDDDIYLKIDALRVTRAKIEFFYDGECVGELSTNPGFDFKRGDWLTVTDLNMLMKLEITS